ncbi:MAG: phosphoribosyltransferase [Micavibrio sp.]|nr:phosphoribosyltransferase [Micavibrio sp.]|tara:strand:- start:67 stop:807 length:741 start_codon:yes stop_codon:yes gene_type:complete
MLKEYASQLLNFLLPLRCPITGEIVDSHGALSASAWSTLNFIQDPLCKSCGLPFSFIDNDEISDDMLCANCIEHPPEFDKARAALTYDDTSRTLLLKFKHGDQLHLAKSFAPFLKTLKDQYFKDADIITPVPLHRWRLLKRRYNQSAILSQAITTLSPELLYTPDLLERTRHTPMQSGAIAKRKKNVSKAFAFNTKYREAVAGKTLLLIDDVYTTGSTVNACAKALKKAGAKKVYVLCVARVCAIE